MIYIDDKVIYTNDSHVPLEDLEEATGKPVFLVEGMVENIGVRKLSAEEYLIQCTKIVLGVIGLVLLAWKL